MTKIQKTIRLLDFILNPKKDIEIFGMFGPGNLGDEAMLHAALSTLPQSRCIPCHMQSRISLIHGLIQRRHRSYLLVGGGTLIHGGATGWLDYVEHRMSQGTKVSFFGTGLAFTDDEITSRSESYCRWSKILKHADEVHLRGSQSVKICHDMGCKHAAVFGDFAFLLHDQQLPITDHRTRSNTIGLNFGLCLGDQERFENSCARLIQTLNKKHYLVIHIVRDNDNESTHRILKIANIPSSKYTIEQHYFDPAAFMNSVKNYRAFIGLKMHAAGLAMVAGVPTLMIAYKPKCFDFMATLGERKDLLIDFPLNVDQTVSRLEQLLDIPQHSIVTNKIAAIAEQQRKVLMRVYLGAAK